MLSITHLRHARAAVMAEPAWLLTTVFCRTLSFTQVWQEGILPFCHGRSAEEKEEKSGGQTAAAALATQLGLTVSVFGLEQLQEDVEGQHSWGSLTIRLLHLSKDQHYCAGWP